MSLSLIPIAFLIGGVVLIAWGVRHRSLAAALPSDWIPVTGTLLADRTRIEYRTPGGRRLRIQMPPETQVEGDEIEVLVDPNDPSRARLVAQDREIARLARNFILLGAGSLLIAILGLVAFG